MAWDDYQIDLGSAQFDSDGTILDYEDQPYSTTNDSDTNDSGTNDTDSDMVSNTRNGIPKTEYQYNGTNTTAFQQWRTGQISTQRFASITAPGNGTASLIPPNQQGGTQNNQQQPQMPRFIPTGGGGDDTMMMVAMVGLAAVAAVSLGGLGGN